MHYNINFPVLYSEYGGGESDVYEGRPVLGEGQWLITCVGLFSSSSGGTGAPGSPGHGKLLRST